MLNKQSGLSLANFLLTWCDAYAFAGNDGVWLGLLRFWLLMSSFPPRLVVVSCPFLFCFSPLPVSAVSSRKTWTFVVSAFFGPPPRSVLVVAFDWTLSRQKTRGTRSSNCGPLGNKKNGKHWLNCNSNVHKPCSRVIQYLYGYALVARPLHEKALNF